MPDALRRVPEMPTNTRAEAALEGAKVLVAGVPVVGGSAAELLELVLGPALSRRRDKWLRQLAELLDELTDRLEGFDPRSLSQNEPFVTAVVQATIIATKTHDEEKLKSLRNALVNSQLPGAPDEFEQMTFLRYVDELQPLHVRALAYIADPGEQPTHPLHRRRQRLDQGVDLGPRPDWGLPELENRPDVSDLVVADLAARGLILRNDYPNGVDDGRTREFSNGATDLGLRFLHFVSRPPAGEPS